MEEKKVLLQLWEEKIWSCRVNSFKLFLVWKDSQTHMNKYHLLCINKIHLSKHVSSKQDVLLAKSPLLPTSTCVVLLKTKISPFVVDQH